MANQLAQMGIAVTLVEKQAHCGGLTRNRKCLGDSHVRLICGQTVTEVSGEKSWNPAACPAGNGSRAKPCS